MLAFGLSCASIPRDRSHPDSCLTFIYRIVLLHILHCVVSYIVLCYFVLYRAALYIACVSLYARELAGRTCTLTRETRASKDVANSQVTGLKAVGVYFVRLSTAMPTAPVLTHGRSPTTAVLGTLSLAPVATSLVMLSAIALSWMGID